MNRIWAAIALFAILIGLGFWGVFGTAAITGNLAGQVEQMEQAIRRRDFSKAEALQGSIQRQWEKDTALFSAYFNHSYLEVVDTELASLRVRLDHREESHALVHCSQLREALKKIQKMEIPYLGNLL